MATEVTPYAIVMATAVSLMFGVIYALRRMDVPMRGRAVVGAVCLAFGLLLGAHLAFGGPHPLETPVVFGCAVGLTGVGINQVISSFRLLARRSA